MTSPTTVWHEGDNVGGWRLERLLGRGGNAEVWSATKDADECALKVLTRVAGDGYLRFRDEIGIYSRVADLAGVLPVHAANLPEHPSKQNPAWLAMPIAEPVERALDRATLEQVVQAMRGMAATLASLHARGISHRDVKPGNLYRHAGQFVIGDFGLVWYPGKDDITRPDKKLGPTHFHAPELLESPATADPAPADVWSFAKTLWVLAAGLRWPRPGHQRADDPAANLSSYVSHDRLRFLDALIDRATRLDPRRRPTMTDLAAELDAWLRPPRASGEPGDLSDLRDAFAPTIDDIQRFDALNQQRVQSVRSVLEELRPALMRTADAFASAGLPVTPPQGGGASVSYGGDQARGELQVSVRIRQRWLVGRAIARLDGEDALTLTLCFDLVNEAQRRVRDPETVWTETRKLALGSAQVTHAVAELGASLVRHSRDAVVRFAEFSRNL